MLKTVKSLRLIGIAEGFSFLILLLIAMPLKYMAGWPYAVKYVGWAHGLLFILYIIAVFAAIKAMKWGFKGVAIALIASLLPAGTLILDRSWRKREKEIQSSNFTV
jgi:integral membrane protein